LTPLVAPFMPEYLGYPITGALLAIFPVALLMGSRFRSACTVGGRQASRRAHRGPHRPVLLAERRRRDRRLDRRRLPDAAAARSGNRSSCWDR
jgi:hypothetical protein